MQPRPSLDGDAGAGGVNDGDGNGRLRRLVAADVRAVRICPTLFALTPPAVPVDGVLPRDMGEVG